jgi:N-acetylglucosamine malate deacetylase 2
MRVVSSDSGRSREDTAESSNSLLLTQLSAGNAMDAGSARLVHASLFGTGELVPQSRCAVIVAHPHDEVIGAGGLIARLKDVIVLHVTDGAVREPQRTGFTRRKVNIKTIKAECASALALANVPEDRIIELGISDHQASYFLVPITRRIAAFLQRSGSEVVLTHAYEGGHPDHDATAFATHAAMRLLKRNGFKPPVLFEIAVRPSDDGKTRVLDFLPGQWRETTTLILNKQGQDLKQRMLDCFRGQLDLSPESPLGREKFRRPPDCDLALAPREGKPNYETFDSELTGSEWTLLAREALTELFPVKRRTLTCSRLSRFAPAHK